MQRNQRIVEEAFDRWSRGQGTILDLMGDDGAVILPGISAHCGTFNKQDFVNDVAIPFMSRFSEPPVPRPSRIIADGDDVIVIADASGVTLEGKPYRNDYVFFLNFRDNKLVQATEFLDMAAFNLVWDSAAPQANVADTVEESL